MLPELFSSPSGNLHFLPQLNSSKNGISQYYFLQLLVNIPLSQMKNLMEKKNSKDLAVLISSFLRAQESWKTHSSVLLGCGFDVQCPHKNTCDLRNFHNLDCKHDRATSITIYKNKLL